MDFRSLTVKECFDNPKAVAIIKELAPSLMKYRLYVNSWGRAKRRT